MAEILGLGVTHFPPLSGPDTNMGRILTRALADPAIPEALRHPESWPAPMRQEYGNDAGVSAAARHREGLLAGFRNARRVLDEFDPGRSAVRSFSVHTTTLDDVFLALTSRTTSGTEAEASRV